MNTMRACLIAVMLFLLPGYAMPETAGYMRISLIQGDVQLRTADAGDWGPASTNGPVMGGDEIWVPEGGRVELQLNSGTYVRLDQGSALQVLSLDKDSSQFYLSQGHIYVYFDALEGSVIQVDTPDASTRAFVNAVFRVDMSDRYQYTDVSVYKGYVETENARGRTRVNADETLSISGDGGGEVAPMGPPDEWERWNKKRNDRIFERRGTSLRYLPPELAVYAYDFDANGRWVNVPGYGYCWTPTVIVGVNWAPYRDGRWIWRGGEYVWVSFEPWGWAPYHYGRWAFSASTGWCWVPPVRGDVYWGPGYVGWVGTANYVAWVPLAPGEIYYGRGYYGRHSVTVTNININEVHITTVYKNVSTANAATIVSRNTFGTASPKIVHFKQDRIRRQIFAEDNISVLTPAIKPARASFFASAKRIQPAKMPPSAVRSLQIDHLRRSRRFIKDPSKSVFDPAAKPRQLPVNIISTPRTPGTGRSSLQSGRPTVEKRHEAKPEKRTAPAERIPAPKEERRETRQERKTAPGGRAPIPKEKRREAKPERKTAPAERINAPKEERRETRQERKPAPRERIPAQVEHILVPKGQKKTVAPAGNHHKTDKKQKTEDTGK